MEFRECAARPTSAMYAACHESPKHCGRLENPSNIVSHPSNVFDWVQQFMTRHVIIVGGGFGGLFAAPALRGAAVHVTLIDKRNYNLFRPMLYRDFDRSVSVQ